MKQLRFRKMVSYLPPMATLAAEGRPITAFDVHEVAVETMYRLYLPSALPTMSDNETLP